MGTVFLMEDITDQSVFNKKATSKYAMKVVTDSSLIPLVKNAVKFIHECDEENIVKLYDAYHFHGDIDSKLIVMMKYYEHGSLQDLIQSKKSKGETLSEDIIYHISAQLCKALKYLHDRFVIHRDISPDNVMIEEIHDDYVKVVLSDFDTVKEIKGTDFHTKVGKVSYMAPEIDSDSYGTKVDIWSLGVAMMDMITLDVNENGNIARKIRDKNLEEKYHGELTHKMKESENYDELWRALILSTLQFDHDERPTAGNLIVVLKINQVERALLQENRGEFEQVLKSIYNGDKIQCLIDASNVGNIKVVMAMISRGADLWSDKLLVIDNQEMQKIIDEKKTEAENHSIIKEASATKNWNDGLQSACHHGECQVAVLTIKNGAYDWNRGLRGASKGGHVELANMMIQNGAHDWNWPLYNACKGGYVEFVTLLIEQGANDWNYGLEAASEGNYIELVNLMIEKGANNFKYGLKGACYGGHIELVNFMIEKGGNNWNVGLKAACAGGHIELANMMIEKGANEWNGGLKAACSEGHLDLVNLMIEKGANNWNEGLKAACDGHSLTHRACADLMIMKGANNIWYLKKYQELDQ